MSNTAIFAILIGTMIAYLSGQFTFPSPTTVWVEVNGVGYEVQISLNTYSKIRDMEKGRLWTYFLVREDAHTLYGFFDQAEKNMFLHLISITGVGAGTARMVLSSLKPDELARAIIQGNSRLLEGVKGIGKKTAERMVMELKDKLQKHQTETANSGLIYNTLEQDALNALTALGISRTMAENAIKKAQTSAPGFENLEELIKKALQSI